MVERENSTMNQKYIQTSKSPTKIFNVFIFSVFMVLFSLSSAFAIADHNLMNFTPAWTLDSDQVISATHFDIGTYNIDGTIINSVTFSEPDAYGEVGKESAYFDGADEYIQSLDSGKIPFTISRDTNFSVSIWFNTTTTGANDILFHVGGQGNSAFGMTAQKRNDGTIRASIVKNAVSNSIIAQGSTDYDGEGWHHLAVNFYAHNTTLEFIVDGTTRVSNSTVYATLSSIPDDDIIIGEGFYNGGYANQDYTGKLDEFYLYPFILTQNDIDAIITDHPYDQVTENITYSTNYTIDITENSYTGNQIVTGTLNISCLDTSLQCNVSAYAQLNGYNASSFSDPLLLPQEFTFFMNPGSISIPFSIQSNYDIIGEFSYNLSNNLSDSAIYLIQQLSDLNITLNIPPPSNETIHIALGGTCPFYETQSDSQFWIYMILGVVTVLTIFTGFIFNSVLLMMWTPFAAIYLSFASASCDMFLAMMWVVICAVACLRILFWIISLFLTKRFRIN